MAYGTPSDPVGGTVITVAYAVANILDPLRWLRLLTGNADPPGSNYVVVSTSTTGTVWAKVTADVLAAGAVVAHLGYTPLKNTTDTLTGTLTVTGLLAGASGVQANGVGGVNVTGGGGYAGGSLLTGVMSLLGLNVGATGIDSAGPITTTGQVSPGSYAGGSTTTGTPSFKGLVVGTDGVVIGSGGVGPLIAAGSVTAGSYAGGSTSAGSPSVLGLTVGNNGVSIGSAGTGPLIAAGSVTAGSYAGGSTSAGTPSMLGVSLGTSGMIANAGPVVGTTGTFSGTVSATGAIASLAGLSGTTITGSSVVQGTRYVSSIPTGTQPWTTTSTTKNDNLNADMTDGAHASATPTANTIPIADASGLLDGWVSPSAGSVPAGIGGYWTGVVASIPTGWTRTTGLNGRVPVGAGTTFSTTFTEGASYGSSWSHSHTTPSHSHSGAPLSVSGTTGNNNNAGQSAGTGTNRADDPHTHTFSASVAGNTATDGSGTSGSTAWEIPMFGVVFVHKT